MCPPTEPLAPLRRRTARPSGTRPRSFLWTSLQYDVRRHRHSATTGTSRRYSQHRCEHGRAACCTGPNPGQTLGPARRGSALAIGGLSSQVGRKAERQPAEVPSPRRMARLETGGMTLSRPGRVNGQTTTSPSFAAGITVPDTKLAAEATELVRDTAPELITITPAGCTGSAACRAATAA
jgi:hypothetical protein